MLYINSITNDPLQQFTLTGIPAIQIPCQLRYMPRIQRWIMDVTYVGFVAQGIAVASSPNFLRKWRNIIPFGLACVCPSGLDPMLVTDFQNQAANLYLLDADDVTAVETEFYS